MAFLEYTPTQTLYQYCSVEGFRGILSSKSIWCSDLDQANDPRELKLGFEHFLAAWKFVRENEYKGEIGNFLDSIKDDVTNYRKRQQTFCACFSLVKDELPMWNEYGNNYSGIAIGFRPTALTTMPGRIQKVKYLDEGTTESFRKIARDIAGRFDPNHSPGDLMYWLEANISAFTAITALKHRSWAHEQEVRFTHAQTRSEEATMQRAEFSDGAPVFWQRPLSRDVRGVQVAYKTFPFGRRRDGISDPTGAIELVVIGPRCTLWKSVV